nr:MAG TPA: coat protein [Inoviridae sp.]
MKMIKKLKTAAYAAPLAVMAALPLSAQAALTDGVKNAITGGFADAQEGAGLMIVGFAAIFGIMLIKRLFTR